MELISKWGCDGSSGYSEYMQKPVDETEEANTEVNDYNLFLITFVPLRFLGILMIVMKICDHNRPVYVDQLRFCTLKKLQCFSLRSLCDSIRNF